MKKIIALILVLILGITLLAGCGDEKKPDDGGDKTGAVSDKTDADGGSGNTADGDKSSYDGSSYGIDLASTEVQQMSETRATKDKLSETVTDWLEGNTMFLEGTEMGSRTYKDFVDYIGCDATEYKYDASYSARFYTWISEDSDNSKLGVWFKEIDGVWCLAFTGATNL